MTETPRTAEELRDALFAFLVDMGYDATAEVVRRETDAIIAAVRAEPTTHAMPTGDPDTVPCCGKDLEQVAVDGEWCSLDPESVTCRRGAA